VVESSFTEKSEITKLVHFQQPLKPRRFKVCRLMKNPGSAPCRRGQKLSFSSKEVCGLSGY